MDTRSARSSVVAGGSLLGIALCLLGCGERRSAGTPPPPAVTPAESSGDRPGHRLFFDDFESAEMAKWEPNEGTWGLQRGGAGGQAYTARGREFALSVAGAASWSDYVVEARLTIHDDRRGHVGLAARLQSGHFYYELVLGRGEGGARSWFLRRRLRHEWTTLASGPHDYPLGEPQILRLSVEGRRLTGAISRDGGRSFLALGAADTSGQEMTTGRIGLVTYGGDATFDDVGVTGETVIFDQANPWGPIVLLRDDTNVFPTGKPAGGWYVAPIHVTLRPADGKVLVSGWSRAGQANCTSGVNSSRNGTSWILDPAALNQPTLFIQPIDEQGEVPATDVLYCAGHNMLPGGRVFYSGGSRHPGGFPHMGELGLNYGRVFDFNTGLFTRITTRMKGGTPEHPGEKWYPTNLQMPDGQVLIFGGFAYNGGGTGERKNRSLELFDPFAWDANPSGDPWTVLTQQNEGQADTVPTRGYTNLFLLPTPIPASVGGGFARTVALAGGVGRVFLFNHEPGPTGAQRLLARPNALTPNMSATEKGEGASGVVLPDGRLMFVNGGHLGPDAAKAYFYTPTTDSWTSVPLGVSRIYGDALFLPDGRIMIVNGYVSEPGNIGDVSEPRSGDVRQPEIIDPYTDPPTVTTLGAWPELPWRGYHSVALLLKDGRILLGAGKDNDHATGCEKNEMRLFEPPYLFGGGARPTIETAEGTSMTVGGPAISVPYTGSVRATRGVALMAPGSLTHGFDMGQRYVPLSFTDNGDGTLTVLPPENINIAPPGEYLMFIVSSTGVPSVGKHIRLAAPPPCRYAVDGASASYIEAEARSRQSGPFAAASDAGRSGGAYVAATELGASHLAAPDEGKVLWYDVDVTSGGTFFLWALANGPDADADSLWVSVDGNPDVALNLPAASWGWAQASASLSLPTGKHTLKIKVREDGALVDKLLLTKNGGFTPVGLGGTALLCNGLPAPTGLVASPGNASVSLSWNPVAGASSYNVKRSTTSGSGHMTVQSGITGTTHLDMGLTNGTPYFYVVTAVNAVGEGPSSNEAPATPVAAPTWSNGDVGAVMAAGSFTQAGGQYTVKGSGADIWSTADEFHFVYQTITGDATITARVTSIQNRNVWSKAGVMMRENNGNANARNVLALVSPTPGNLYRFQARTTAGGSTSSAPGGGGAVPVYLRLVRAGNTFKGYFSTDNVMYTQVGATTTIAMGSTLRVGLAVTSHADGLLADGVFDNVSITTPQPPQPPPAPTNLMVSGGAGQAQLSWTDNASNETSTKIERKPQADPDSSFAQIATVGANVATYLNTPVPAGAYTWRVRASNAAGDSEYSNSASATVTAPPSGPAAPSNLVATVTVAANGNASATLSWSDNSSNEAGFRVEKKVGTGGFTLLANKTADSIGHTDAGPLALGTYTYRVIATGSPESAPSNEAVVILGNPAADAYVRGGTSAGTNFGTATVIDVKHTNTATTKRNAFLRFGLAGVAANVTSAKLRLFGNAATTAKATNVHSVADITWIESGTGGITWNTPTVDAGGPAMSPTPLATQTVGLTAGWVEWDVTAYVQQRRAAGATAISLGVKSGVLSDEGQTTFNSRQGTNKPVLIINSRP